MIYVKECSDYVFQNFIAWSYAAAAAAAKSRQSCPTLCGPIDGSPSGYPVPGILQAVKPTTGRETSFYSQVKDMDLYSSAEAHLCNNKS